MGVRPPLAEHCDVAVEWGCPLPLLLLHTADTACTCHDAACTLPARATTLPARCLHVPRRCLHVPRAFSRAYDGADGVRVEGV